MEHSDIPAGEVHAPHNWRVADEAERLALVVADADIGKYLWQLSDNTEWFLTSATPTAVWQQHIGPKGDKGDAGDTGLPGADGAPGAPGADGAPGSDGREVELQTNATHVQWRYAGDLTWTDLVPLITITGPAGADGADGAAGADGANGREVQLQAGTTHIQWRYVGDTTWIDLVSLAAITGPAGADGGDGREVELQANATHVQWRYVGDPTWTDLVPLSAITGPAGADGANGTNGREVELQKSATHIQWRLVGDTTWVDLVALVDLKGEKGDPGAGGTSTPPEVKTVAFTAVAGGTYACSTAGGAFTALLPSAPQPGWKVSFIDYAGTFDISNLTVNPNGSKMLGLDENYVLDQKNRGRTFVCVDATKGWMIYA